MFHGSAARADQYRSASSASGASRRSRLAVVVDVERGEVAPQLLDRRRPGEDDVRPGLSEYRGERKRIGSHASLRGDQRKKGVGAARGETSVREGLLDDHAKARGVGLREGRARRALEGFHVA